MTGLAPTWVPAGPGWAAGCAVFRCTACGLWRHAPYDPKDGAHYPDRQPLPREAHVLWVAARDRGTRLALDERVRSALVLAMDRDLAASSPAEDEVARLAAEIRSRLG